MVHTVIHDREASKTGLLLPMSRCSSKLWPCWAFAVASSWNGGVTIGESRDLDLLVFGSKRAQGRHASRGDEVQQRAETVGGVVDTEWVRRCFGQCWMVVEA